MNFAVRPDSDWYLRRCIRCRERIHTEDPLYCPHCGEFLGAG
jgi:rRNA maturation endonuclease Nob1